MVTRAPARCSSAGTSPLANVPSAQVESEADRAPNDVYRARGRAPRSAPIDGLGAELSGVVQLLAEALGIGCFLRLGNGDHVDARNFLVEDRLGPVGADEEGYFVAAVDVDCVALFDLSTDTAQVRRRVCSPERPGGTAAARIDSFAGSSPLRVSARWSGVSASDELGQG